MGTKNTDQDRYCCVEMFVACETGLKVGKMNGFYRLLAKWG